MMKKKNDFTKNEQQFSDLLIKSVEEHTADPEPPHIDYSFLDEGGDKDIRVEVAAKRRLAQSRGARFGYLVRVFCWHKPGADNRCSRQSKCVENSSRKKTVCVERRFTFN